MPTYEFLCQNCKEASAFICSIMEYERKKKFQVQTSKTS